ncbi:aldo/keto reductase [Alkalibacillus aidingensis]|uniref:aldo/keto reductase n=1 Tax=Alkalibacillus aidingensis TaxID=2747607 RepID=UPI0016618121|nr:aldo/keto reductase [Alkalibacillus aidingensis]
MKHRQLGSTNLHISEIALGCMNLGTDAYKAKSIINEAIDSGINYLDTADLYDYGENEKVVGRAIKGRRDDLVIATKGGNHFDPSQEGWYWDPSKGYLKEAIKNSLLRLGLDDVDLYQLHGGTIDDLIDEVIETFEELKQEGLIKHYGLSSIRPNVIKQFVKKANIESVMMQYSLLDRRPEEEIIDLFAENQISLLARGVLGKGMLTNFGMKKWSTKGQKGFLDYNSDTLLETIKELQTLASDSGITPQSLAIGYALKQPTVSSLVLGASQPEQITANIEAYHQATISDELYTKLQQITKASLYQNHR